MFIFFIRTLIAISSNTHFNHDFLVKTFIFATNTPIYRLWRGKVRQNAELARNCAAKKRVGEKSVIIWQIKDEIWRLRLAKPLKLRPILWVQL